MEFIKKILGKKSNDDLTMVSLLSPKQVKKKGNLPSKAICGKFENGIKSPEYFIENKDFVEFMHSTICNSVSSIVSLNEAARQQNEGFLYIIDFRTADGIMGDVPPEDIIGAFSVKNGMLVENSYQKNDQHKIYTKNGLVKLPPEIENLIIEELLK